VTAQQNKHDNQLLQMLSLSAENSQKRQTRN